MWYRKLEPKMWRYELRYHRIVFAMFFRKAQQELRTPNALRSLILRQLRLKLMTLGQAAAQPWEVGNKICTLEKGAGA